MLRSSFTSRFTSDRPIERTETAIFFRLNDRTRENEMDSSGRCLTNGDIYTPSRRDTCWARDTRTRGMIGPNRAGITRKRIEEVRRGYRVLSRHHLSTTATARFVYDKWRSDKPRVCFTVAITCTMRAARKKRRCACATRPWSYASCTIAKYRVFGNSFQPRVQIHDS